MKKPQEIKQKSNIWQLSEVRPFLPCLRCQRVSRNRADIHWRATKYSLLLYPFFYSFTLYSRSSLTRFSITSVHLEIKCKNAVHGAPGWRQ